MTVIHKFEAAGLGKAPFKLAGYRKLEATTNCPKPGGSCDFCGTYIIDAFLIESSDGKVFKVGCNCVKKTGDKGLYDTVKRELNKLKAEARRTKEKEKIDQGMLEYLSVRERFTSKPHPNLMLASKGKTLADYYDWIFKEAGNSGKLRVLREIMRIISGD